MVGEPFYCMRAVFRLGSKEYTMLFNRRIARDFLLAQDRPSFLDIVYKAKVTPIQKEILYLSLLDQQDHYFIADKLGLEKTTIDHQIGKAYDLIFRYINNTVFQQ